MSQQISQPRHPFSTALQRSQSTFGLQGLDFLGKTGGLVVLQEFSECVTAIDVLSVYKAKLELEIWPIHDGCSIGTRSSAQMFHSRHPLLLIHNTYWYKNLMEECQPLSPPACPSQPLLALPTKVWALTGSPRQPGSRLRTWVIFCLELDSLFGRTESAACCPERRKERLNTGEGLSAS